MNGEPFYFTGFGMHKDHVTIGKGHSDAQMVNDFELLRPWGSTPRLPASSAKAANAPTQRTSSMRRPPPATARPLPNSLPGTRTTPASWLDPLRGSNQDAGFPQFGVPQSQRAIARGRNPCWALL
ncbi:glycoside hydrolase family 2 TIM barrel-domain containing protein [Arthrobacter sp. NPDC080031]|uniref:glycoside hydrolase family 2 TIM barrel-domain containing protein n=1 Tax=Arthrobacter sp. NPDC080031 TaxID=3155918 RepID=UPI00344D1046